MNAAGGSVCSGESRVNEEQGAWGMSASRVGECRLWDSDREESIPADEIVEVDTMLFDVTLPSDLLVANADTRLNDRVERLLGADFGIIEARDGSTTLVELLNGPEALAAVRAGGVPAILRCLEIG
jgi:hypothetical protein